MNLTERIAEDIWWMLKHSREWEVRLGEETLTDLLVLRFMRFKPSHYKLFQTSKEEESRIGADLEIRLYAGEDQAAVFAVQAKKLYPSGRYDALNARVKSSGFSQIETLEKYSKNVGALPLYLLYNYVDQHDMQSYWHCCQCLDERQLGCTLVPSWIIRQAISNHGCRNFDWIHTSCTALPWRCLFDCPQVRDHPPMSTARRTLSMFRDSFQQWDEDQESLPVGRRDLAMFRASFQQPNEDQNYNWVEFEPVKGAWPERLWNQPSSILSDEDFKKLRERAGVFYTEEMEGSDSPTQELVPHRLLLIKEDDSSRGEDKIQSDDR